MMWLRVSRIDKPLPARAREHYRSRTVAEEAAGDQIRRRNVLALERQRRDLHRYDQDIGVREGTKVVTCSAECGRPRSATQAR